MEADQKEKINQLENIKSRYILKKLFNHITIKKSLGISKYNNKLKKIINLNINDYKEYSEQYSSIEIEIKLAQDKNDIFINIKKEDEMHFHIYFNNNNEDYCRINKSNMSYMFSGCSSLKELNLSNFNTNNVTNMSYMISGCSSLKGLNLSNFNTNNATDMSYMFSECSSLKGLNLSNFNTNNVTDMGHMFFGCSGQFQNKIKAQYRNIKEEAFIEF